MQMIINPDFNDLHVCFLYLRDAPQKTAENESVCSYVFKIRNDILQIGEYRFFLPGENFRGETPAGKEGFFDRSGIF
jgi:hypothetical protein